MHINCARETVKLLHRDIVTPDFIQLDLWLLNSFELNPVDYQILGDMSILPYKHHHTTRQRWLTETVADSVLLQPWVPDQDIWLSSNGAKGVKQ